LGCNEKEGRAKTRKGGQAMRIAVLLFVSDDGKAEGSPLEPPKPGEGKPHQPYGNIPVLRPSLTLKERRGAGGGFHTVHTQGGVSMMPSVHKINYPLHKCLDGVLGWFVILGRVGASHGGTGLMGMEGKVVGVIAKGHSMRRSHQPSYYYAS